MFEFKSVVITPHNETEEEPFVRAEQAELLFLNERQYTYSRNALGLMYLLDRNQYLDLNQTRRVLEFGAGSGRVSIALRHLAQEFNWNYRAVEKNPFASLELIEYNILPPEQIYFGDGISYIEQEGSREPFDLICAGAFGPDIEGELFPKLVQSCTRGLSENGKLVLWSDPDTMTSAYFEALGQKINFDFFVDAGAHPQYYIHKTMIISAEQLKTRESSSYADY